ncbi:transposable element Tcb2 transposase [Trichonephila clavipes]|nr:transposable element Tcb2 transposase [Trichonephila clavipes]
MSLLNVICNNPVSFIKKRVQCTLHVFSLYFHVKSTRNRRPPLQVRETYSCGSGGLMVWTCITSNGRIHRYVFTKCVVTGVRYRNNVLASYTRLFTGAVVPGFILMDGEFLESKDICRMDWPVRSPDLIYIEYIWYALGRAIQTRDSLRKPSKHS